MWRMAVRSAIIVAVFLVGICALWATDYVDVVYLKNGSVVRGTIIEQIPNVRIKIKTADGSIFAFKMSEIAKITKEEVTVPEAPQMASLNILFNPLGFMQFGPMVQMEFRISPGLYGVAHVRLQGLGLVPQILYTSKPRLYSIAAGGGVRYFFTSKSTPSAPYIGGLAEFGYDPYTGDVGTKYEYEGSSLYITVAANGGYRWRWGNFMMDVGAYAGASPTLSDNWHYLTSPSVNNPGDTSILIFAMLELSFGWEL